MAGDVIAFNTRPGSRHSTLPASRPSTLPASRHRGLRFTSAEKKIVSVLGQIPGYEVSFESEDETTEWAVISANGGNYTLVDLARISLVPGGFRVVDGSAHPAGPFESVEEAVMTAWRAVWRRMAAFGLR